MNFDSAAILTVKQKLVPAFDGDPIKPPTFLGNDDSAQYIIYQNNGRRDVILDTHQSQANRIEPMFDGTGLIPDSTVRVGERIVPVTALGHRVADAALRFSDAEEAITAALKAYASGDAEPLARLAPTSLLFGAWDSRGNARVKVTRMVSAEIRATDVSEADFYAWSVPILCRSSPQKAQIKNCPPRDCLTALRMVSAASLLTEKSFAQCS